MRAILRSLLDHHQAKYENDETKSSTYDLKNCELPTMTEENRAKQTIQPWTESNKAINFV